MKFFTNKEDTHSSPLGGIVTLIFASILMIITFKVLLDTIIRQNYFLEMDAVPIKDLPSVINMTMSDFFETTLIQPNVLVYHKNLTDDCSTLEVSIVYNATEIVGAYKMKEFETKFYDKEGGGCIFLGNLSDPLYKSAIDAFADRPAISHEKLGYVFMLGVYVANVKQGMVTVNWLEIDTIG